MAKLKAERPKLTVSPSLGTVNPAAKYVDPEVKATPVAMRVHEDPHTVLPAGCMLYHV